MFLVHINSILGNSKGDPRIRGNDRISPIGTLAEGEWENTLQKRRRAVPNEGLINDHRKIFLHKKNK